MVHPFLALSWGHFKHKCTDFAGSYSQCWCNSG